MHHTQLLILTVIATASCGGGDDNESALEGLFELARWTNNPDGCDGEGAPGSEETDYTHFFVRHENILGERFITMATCEDLDTCRSDAADDDTIFLSGFSFEAGDDKNGWTGRSGALYGENCDGEVYADLLTGEPGTAVEIRREIRLVTDVPLDDEGWCDFEAAYAQADDGRPCEQLTVVTGAFLESI